MAVQGFVVREVLFSNNRWGVIVFFRFRWGDVGFERAGCTVGLRGIRPARAEEASERIGLSRCARGGGLFASKARFGRIPLPCVRGEFLAVCVWVGF